MADNFYIYFPGKISLTYIQMFLFIFKMAQFLLINVSSLLWK